MGKEFIFIKWKDESKLNDLAGHICFKVPFQQGAILGLRLRIGPGYPSFLLTFLVEGGVT